MTTARGHDHRSWGGGDIKVVRIRRRRKWDAVKALEGWGGGRRRGEEGTL